MKYSIGKAAPGGTIEVYLRDEANGNRIWTSELKLATQYDHQDAANKIFDMNEYGMNCYIIENDLVNIT